MEKVKFLFVLTLGAICFASCTPVSSAQNSDNSDNQTTDNINDDGDSTNTDNDDDGGTTVIDIDDDTHTETDTSAYYSTISSSLKGDNLKVELYKIIKGHTKYSYDNLEIAMRITDRDWTKSPNVNDQNPKMHLLYLVDNENKPKLWNTYHGNGGITDGNKAVWNKEHIWAKANGFPSKGLEAYCDLHHLRASDKLNNGSRSNYPFATASTGSYVKDFDGNNSGKLIKSTLYEPQDCDKGDVARALFYMATRYYSGDGSASSLSLTDGKDSSGGKWGYVSTLLQWNEQDPPDAFEKHRNDLIYEQFQHNRNPFVDHPEYAKRIWGK
ncbi:MAG: endonuclease [Firmicutes bacterium]|nr:endonuclease [Candidatus Fiminaster equi]